MQLNDNLHLEILGEIRNIRKDETLYTETNFQLRSQAIDYLEFHVIDRIEGLMCAGNEVDELLLLKQLAIEVLTDLETVNATMFDLLRKKISLEGYRGKAFTDLIEAHFDNDLAGVLKQDTTGYDNLDMFLNGLLSSQTAPRETKVREPEMVFYQKTPARVIFELISKAEFTPHDVFYDLGSGLGQVVILVNLMASVTSIGVEFDPAFCSYAEACVAGLDLDNMQFINTDARYADYSSGTVFFMYTPFEGKMLDDVLQRLRSEAGKRTIKIFTYGPCTREVARQPWLTREVSITDHLGALGQFISAEIS